MKLGDTDGLRASAERSRALGYDGKWCIHPAQVDVCNEVYAPTAEEIARARQLLGLGGVARVGGRDGRRGEPADGRSDPRAPSACVRTIAHFRSQARRRLLERDLVVELRLAAKMALGGTVAWWLAVELGAKRPIFAALVPLVAMTGDPFAAVSVSIGRIVGVFAGVGLGIAFVHVATASTVRVAAILFLGTLGSVVLKVGSRPNLEVPIAGLFMLGFATTAVGQLGVQRIWETAIGGGIAILVSSLLWPPDPARELTRQLERLRRELVGDLTSVADDLATGSGHTAEQIDNVRAHSLEAIRDVFELNAARQALRWSPLRRRDADRVDELERRIRFAARVYRHTRAVARDVADARLDRRLPRCRHPPPRRRNRPRCSPGAWRAEPLDRARGCPRAGRSHGDAAIVAAQLRQLLADMRTAVAD